MLDEYRRTGNVMQSHLLVVTGVNGIGMLHTWVSFSGV
jgi:hypothetical protein